LLELKGTEKAGFVVPMSIAKVNAMIASGKRNPRFYWAASCLSP